MRTWLTTWPVLLVWAGVACAGVYNPMEKPVGPPPGKALPLKAFEFMAGDQLGIRIPDRKTALRKHYLQKASELQAKVDAGSSTTGDRVALSAYLIGLGSPEEYQQAIQVLEPLAREPGQQDFMVLANLGTAYQITGEYDRAIAYLQMARRAWPKEYPGMTADQLKWYRRVEDYQLRLLYSRSRERQGARPPTIESVDPIFGKVRFVGPDGTYEAGKLAEDQKKLLPADALAIVQQLLLWLPEPDGPDVRLTWLLGELYNAQGYVEEAHALLFQCLWNRKLSARELREHVGVLKIAVDKLEAERAKQPTSSNEIEPVVLPESIQRAERAKQAASTNATGKPGEERKGWQPDLQQLLLLGGVVGLLVLFFGYLQIRELCRRRHMAANRQGSP